MWDAAFCKRLLSILVLKGVFMKYKKMCTVIAILMFSILLEVFYFNYGVIYSKIMNLKPVTYNIEDTQIYNWNNNTKGKGIVSDLDPNIIVQDIDSYLKNIAIIVETDQTIPYV